MGLLGSPDDKPALCKGSLNLGSTRMFSSVANVRIEGTARDLLRLPYFPGRPLWSSRLDWEKTAAQARKLGASVRKNWAV